MGEETGYKKISENRTEKEREEGGYDNVDRRRRREKKGDRQRGKGKEILVKEGVGKKYKGKFKLS